MNIQSLSEFKSFNERLRNGDGDEAINGYKELISKHKFFFPYRQNLAMAYARRRSFDAAAKAAREALSFFPAKRCARELFDSYEARRNNGFEGPKLSIIVPVYNTKKYLPKCIDSILNQSFRDFELIVINDGSIDGSYGIIKKFQKLDSRIILISNPVPSGNPGSPRNQGLSVARGQYVGFVDSDDWIDSDFYAALMGRAESTNADIVFSGGFKNHEGSKITLRRYNSPDFANADSDFYKYHDSFMIWDKVFKRSVLEDFDIKLGETKAAVDVPFIFRAYFYSHAISFCDDLISYNYRRESQSSVTVNFRKKSSCEFEFLAYDSVESWAAMVDVPEYFKKIIEIKKFTSFIYTLGIIHQDEFDQFFNKAKQRLGSIQRSDIALFAKAMKKGWVLKKFDQFMKSDSMQFWALTRDIAPLPSLSSPVSKLTISGSKKGVIFFPAWVRSNPYQKMFYEALSDATNLSVAGFAPDELSVELLSGMRTKYDYVHFHWLHSFLWKDGKESDFVEKIRAIKSLGYKIIYTAHNIVSHESPDVLRELQLRTTLAREFDYIIAHGEAAKIRLINEVAADPAKISIVPHGAYAGYYKESVTREAARDWLEVPQDAFVFLFFGAIRAYKGLFSLIDAFSAIQSACPRAVLVIAGRVDSVEVEEDIRKRLASLEGVVFRPGFVKDEEVQNYLYACDSVVLPYERILTSGAACLALSFGRPIIAPRAGVLPEFVGADLGDLFDSMDEMKGLMVRWYELWKSSGFVKRFGSEAFDSFRTEYDWRRLINSFSLVQDVNR